MPRCCGQVTPSDAQEGSERAEPIHLVFREQALVEARESCDVPCLPQCRASLLSPLLREAIRQVADGAFRGGTLSTSQWTLGRRRHYPNALGPIRHALEAAVRNSLGFIRPAQKHHWAEHLAMPCPA